MFEANIAAKHGVADCRYSSMRWRRPDEVHGVEMERMTDLRASCIDWSFNGQTESGSFCFSHPSSFALRLGVDMKCELAAYIGVISL